MPVGCYVNWNDLSRKSHRIQVLPFAISLNSLAFRIAISIRRFHFPLRTLSIQKADFLLATDSYPSQTLAVPELLAKMDSYFSRWLRRGALDPRHLLKNAKTKS